MTSKNFSVWYIFYKTTYVFMNESVRSVQSVFVRYVGSLGPAGFHKSLQLLYSTVFRFSEFCELQFFRWSNAFVYAVQIVFLTMNSLASPVAKGQGRVTAAGSYLIPWIWNRSQKTEYWEKTVSNFDMGFFAHCYQEHWQNEIHYKVHLSILFPKRNSTFHRAFLSRLSVL